MSKTAKRKVDKSPKGVEPELVKVYRKQIFDGLVGLRATIDQMESHTDNEEGTHHAPGYILSKLHKKNAER